MVGGPHAPDVPVEPGLAHVRARAGQPGPRHGRPGRSQVGPPGGLGDRAPGVPRRPGGGVQADPARIRPLSGAHPPVALPRRWPRVPSWSARLAGVLVDTARGVGVLDEGRRRSSRVGGVVFISNQDIDATAMRFVHRLLVGSPVTLAVDVAWPWPDWGWPAGPTGPPPRCSGVLVCAVTGLLVSPITWVPPPRLGRPDPRVADLGRGPTRRWDGSGPRRWRHCSGPGRSGVVPRTHGASWTRTGGNWRSGTPIASPWWPFWWGWPGCSPAAGHGACPRPARPTVAVPARTLPARALPARGLPARALPARACRLRRPGGPPRARSGARPPGPARPASPGWWRGR